MKGLTVCVGFDDLLAVTLPRNLRHFERVLVVTDALGAGAAHVVHQLRRTRPDDVALLSTDVFYDRKATFNKGAAIEGGLNVLGREGWLCLFDADVVMPPMMDLSGIEIGNVYSPTRRWLNDPMRWREYEAPESWQDLPVYPDRDLPGCMHLFHASDPHLGDPPWYGVNWRHAGGCDTDFLDHWPKECWKWLPFEVLHLGPTQENWWGRATPRLDGTIPAGAEAAAGKTARMRADRRLWGYRKEKLK